MEMMRIPSDCIVINIRKKRGRILSGKHHCYGTIVYRASIIDHMNQKDTELLAFLCMDCTRGFLKKG